MRKFIISDIHGNGEVYDSIMAYLDNISDNEEVILFINGDLIDRGLDSYRVFKNVIDRISGIGKINIKYLGGNHELMMYEALKKRKPNGNFDFWCNWFYNGGYMLECELEEEEDFEEKCAFYTEFLGNLDIYHKFREKVDDKNILLVHAATPLEVKDKCDMKIKDNNSNVEHAVWTRKEIYYSSFFGSDRIMGYNQIGNSRYLNIVGHTPVDDKKGFIYDEKENYFNIDGGCAYYACGYFNREFVPLVEVNNGYIRLLVFNHNNEIVNGYYFDGKLENIDEESINNERLFLDRRFNNIGLGARKRIKNSLNND